MGNIALQMLQCSVEALKKLDMDLARNCYDLKDKLMDYDEEIEDKTIKLAMLYQPMAKDIRTIACILKLITSLTRIGRYGKDISNIVIKELDGVIHIKKIVSIPQMIAIVAAMVKDAIKAFETNDVEILEDFEERDDEVDELRISIFRECLTYMMEDPKNIKICTAYIMIARYLERCGDHACKMAEKIYYMVTGKRKEIK